MSKCGKEESNSKVKARVRACLCDVVLRCFNRLLLLGGGTCEIHLVVGRGAIRVSGRVSDRVREWNGARVRACINDLRE